MSLYLQMFIQLFLTLFLLFLYCKNAKKTLLICLQFTSVLGPVQPRQRDGRESNGLAGQGGN